MKHFIVFLVSIITCSAQKADYDVINDFLELELKDLKYDSIYVQKEPLDIYRALQLYEKGFDERDNQNASSAFVWTVPELKKWPLDEKDITHLKDSVNVDRNDWRKRDDWSKKDFRNKSFIFKDEAVVQDMKFRFSHIDYNLNEYVLRVSKPLYVKGKQYALFEFYFYKILFGHTPTTNKGVVVMKKENGKWIVLSSIREAVYE